MWPWACAGRREWRQKLWLVLEERNHHVGDFRHIVEISDLFAWTVLLVAVSILFEKAFLWLLDLCVNRAIRWEG